MNTSIRIIDIPALVTTATVTSLRDALTPRASQAAPAKAQPPLASMGLPRLTLTVTARRVRGVPLTLPAGRYQLTVVEDTPINTAPSGVTLIQLPPGVTLADAMAAADDAQDAPPPFFSQSIMPGGAEIGPDGIGMAVVDLVPGHWVVAGYAMTTEPTTMTVTGRMPTTLHEPRASATVTIGRRGLKLDRRVLRRGENVIRVDNADTTPHVVSIERVPRGTTPASVEATLRRRAGRRSAMPPLAPEDIRHITSTTDQSGGTSMWLPVDLPPGTYAVIGDVTAPTRTMSHDLPGAAAVVTVV